MVREPMVPLGSRGTFRIGASNKSGCPSTTREESDRASLFHAKSVGRSSSLHDPNRPSASETRDYKNWGTSICCRAFPYRISGEKKSLRRCKETVLLNWEPTGGLEPPAFSLPSGLQSLANSR